MSQPSTNASFRPRYRNLLAITLAAALAFSSVLSGGPIASAAPGDAFPDTPGAVYISQENPTVLYRAVTLGDGTVTFLRQGDAADVTYNGTAYDTNGDYLYAVVYTGAQPFGTIIRIGQDNIYTVVKNAAGTPLVLPALAQSAWSYNSGSFGPDGYYYVASSSGNTIYVYDVTSASPHLVRTFTVSGYTGNAFGPDFVFKDGYIWSAVACTMRRINMTTGVSNTFPLTNANGQTMSGPYGAQWQYGNGNLGISDNGTGTVYQIAITNPTGSNPTFSVVSSQIGPLSSVNDGAANPGHPVDLGLKKSISHGGGGDGSVTFSLTVTNNSSYASSGYYITDVLPAGMTGPVSSPDGCTVSTPTTGTNAGKTVVTCNGDQLAAGASRTFKVVGYMTGTPDCVTNTATVTGNESDPVASNNSSSASVCLSDLDVTKRASVSSDGRTVTFTIDVKNTGSVDYPTNYPAKITDDLSGVLDDMVYNNNLTTSYSGSTNASAASGSLSGTTLSWSGPLQAGETATITYSATLPSGSTLNGDFAANNKACVALARVNECATTTSPLPGLKVTKTVSPQDGSAVAAGDVLTYTLTFDNSKGKAAATVNETDALSGVLDDANVTTAPSASTSDLTVSSITNGAFTVTGSVPTGRTVTVTYRVTVKADGSRGDNTIANFVVPTGTTPPSSCAATSDRCTVNRVPQLVVSKTVNPGDGTAVAAGDTLTYTVTFDNSKGTAAAPVAETDALSGVLDDADVTTAPSASTSDLTVSSITNGTFTVTGSVPAGRTVTVTYAVKVKADGSRGDNVVTNFVFATGATPPTSCAADSATCTANPIAQLVISKSVDPQDGSTVKAGDELTYTITFDNSKGKAPVKVAETDALSGVLDDADVTTAPSASTSDLTVSSITNGAFTVTGSVPAGRTVTVTYKVVVKPDGSRGDNSIANFVVPTGTTPPSTCAPDDASCTVNTVAELVVTKTVDPADGTAVKAGDTLTYTITFSNARGKASADVDMVDNLAGVLDDADVTTAPSASTSDLTVSGIANGQFTVQGSVPAGQTVTVTYVVTVKPDGSRGDNSLMNVVLPPGVDPPAECDPDDPVCTTNTVPELVVSKSVDPTDGTAVAPGDKLTYTITFDNSKGTAPASVDQTDALAGVLDDADVTMAPSASTSDLTVSSISNGSFTVTGAVPAGGTVTVTYTVTVKPDGSRGDNAITNFVIPTGTNPPGECADDAATCTTNPVAQLAISKSVDPADGTAVKAGDELTYTITFDNSAGKAAASVDETDSLSNVLDDADVTADPSASTSDLSVSGISNGAFTVTGSVPAGRTVTVTYKVTVKPDGSRGDNTLANFVVPTGTTPPSECAADDATCTVNTAAELVVTKTVDPADGTAVKAGDTLTYTITFANTKGTAAAPVDVVDSLTGVIDDADVTTAPSASSGDLTVSSITDGQFTVKGSVPAGGTVTVTYRVTVKPDGSRGDNSLMNVVLPPGVDPPAECDADDPVCTTNTVPELVVSKSVDPADGSAVKAGDELTYTVTFDNAKGTAPASVDETDALSGVLDDADVTTAPSASTSDLSVSSISNGSFTVTGSVPAGGTVTVTYTVTVKPDGQRGDNAIANFIVPTGTTPPSECPADDATCTTNTAPELVVTKTVDPADGTAVKAGDQLTYTLTFANTKGTAAAPVDVVDWLSEVLDDAELAQGPDASTSDLTVSPVTGGQFTVKGSVPAGETVTVT